MSTMLVAVSAAPAGAWYCPDGEVMRVALKAANGRYVSAEVGWYHGLNGTLRARASRIGPWEEFEITCFRDGRFSIWSNAARRYVSAELSWGPNGYPYATLRARAREVHSWERFWVRQTPWNQPSPILSLANNRWVSAELGWGSYWYGTLRARRHRFQGTGAWEQFRLVFR